MSTDQQTVLLAGYTVDKSTLLMAGVGGGVMFLVMLGSILACVRKMRRKPLKAGGYRGVSKSDTNGVFSIDVEDDQEVDEDNIDEMFDEEPHLTKTSTLNNRKLDLSKFVQAHYPDEEEDTESAGFDFDKCLAYTTKYLYAWKKENPAAGDVPELDVEEYIAELEARWRLIDEQCVGGVTRNQLREAVWHNDADYEGQPMPEGPLPEALQDIVDDIISGIGMQDNCNTFSFWEFANYLLRDADGIDYGVIVPAAPASWGRV